jgi:hypothetical protein
MEEARPSRREGGSPPVSTERFADLLGDINLARADNPCNGITNGSFAVQNHVEVGPSDAVVLCKSGLTSVTFNCGPQQENNISFIKHKRVKAQVIGNEGRTWLVSLCHWGIPQGDALAIQRILQVT